MEKSIAIINWKIETVYENIFCYENYLEPPALLFKKPLDETQNQ